MNTNFPISMLTSLWQFIALVIVIALFWIFYKKKNINQNISTACKNPFQLGFRYRTVKRNIKFAADTEVIYTGHQEPLRENCYYEHFYDPTKGQSYIFSWQKENELKHFFSTLIELGSEFVPNNSEVTFPLVHSDEAEHPLKTDWKAFNPHVIYFTSVLEGHDNVISPGAWLFNNIETLIPVVCWADNLRLRYKSLEFMRLTMNKLSIEYHPSNRYMWMDKY